MVGDYWQAEFLQCGCSPCPTHQVPILYRRCDVNPESGSQPSMKTVMVGRDRHGISLDTTRLWENYAHSILDCARILLALPNQRGMGYFIACIREQLNGLLHAGVTLARMWRKGFIS